MAMFQTPSLSAERGLATRETKCLVGQNLHNMYINTFKKGQFNLFAHILLFSYLYSD